MMKSEVIRWLDIGATGTYLDCTAGYGGHFTEIANYASQGRVIAIDQDIEAIRHLKSKFKDVYHLNFDSIATSSTLKDLKFDGILLDLGVSSHQLDEAERGFSFSKEATLDMRMNQAEELSALSIINEYSEEEIADILWKYGQEKASRHIAAAIVSARPLTTTTDLAKVVRQVINRRGKTDSATRTFQALRIMVNRELERLERSLPDLIGRLKPGGRIVILTYHSLEDRIVKTLLKSDRRLEVLTKKPITPQDGEISNNPRARSAKLRAASKQT